MCLYKYDKDSLYCFRFRSKIIDLLFYTNLLSSHFFLKQELCYDVPRFLYILIRIFVYIGCYVLTFEIIHNCVSRTRIFLTKISQFLSQIPVISANGCEEATQGYSAYYQTKEAWMLMTILADMMGGISCISVSLSFASISSEFCAVLREPLIPYAIPQYRYRCLTHILTCIFTLIS